MKGHPFHKRFCYALAGIRHAVRHERSFRTQLLLGAIGVALSCWLAPSLLWLALVCVMASLVLAAELFNTALEQMLDALHPEQAEFVRIAKDCAAAAVLLLSLAAAVTFLLMLLDIALSG